MRLLCFAVVFALALPHAQAARQDAPGDLRGTWVALKLETSKGALDIDPDASPFTLLIEGQRFTFTSPFGSSWGRTMLNAKEKVLDLHGDREVLPCTYRFQDGLLLLTIWPNAGVRDQGGA